MRNSIVLLLVVVLQGCGQRSAWNPTLSPPGISLANFARLENGMTMEEVKGILGPPRQSMYSEGDDRVWQDPKPGETEHLKDKVWVRWDWFTQHRHLESLDIHVRFEKGKAVSFEEYRGKIDPR